MVMAHGGVRGAGLGEEVVGGLPGHAQEQGADRGPAGEPAGPGGDDGAGGQPGVQRVGGVGLDAGGQGDGGVQMQGVPDAWQRVDFPEAGQLADAGPPGPDRDRRGQGQDEQWPGPQGLAVAGPVLAGRVCLAASPGLVRAVSAVVPGGLDQLGPGLVLGPGRFAGRGICVQCFSCAGHRLASAIPGCRWVAGQVPPVPDPRALGCAAGVRHAPAGVHCAVTHVTWARILSSLREPEPPGCGLMFRVRALMGRDASDDETVFEPGEEVVMPVTELLPSAANPPEPVRSPVNESAGQGSSG